MMLLLGSLLLLGCAGLLLVRSAPAPARALGLPALVLVAAAALDPERPELRDVPTRVAVVPTAAPGADVAEVAARARSAGAATQTPELAAFADRLCAAVALAGPRADEAVVVWTGPAADAAGTPPGLGAVAVSRARVLPFDPRDLRVLSPGPLQAGRPALLEVALASGSVPVEATLIVQGEDGGERLRQELQLAPGLAAPVRLLPDAPGRLRLDLRASVEGAMATRWGWLDVQPPPPVLVVGADAALAAALAAQGATVTVAAALPEDLERHAAVVLAVAPGAGDADRLIGAVQDGLGLLVTGAALVPGPLDPLLPVRLLPAAGGAPGAEGAPTAGPGRPGPTPLPPPSQRPGPDRPVTGNTEGARPDPGPPVEVDRRSVALVLVVDRSGSMGEPVAGRPKMSYAKTSALRTAEALAAGDEVGIVTFGNPGAGRIEMPLTAVTESARVQGGVERLAHAAEFTYLRPGLEVARDLLRGPRAAVRHVVVISDGDLHDDEIPLVAVARECRQLGITVSILQIFDQAGANAAQKIMTERVAATGGGLRYECTSAAQVPVLVSQEVVRALDRVGRRPTGEGPGPGPGPDPAPDRPEPSPPEPPGPQPERLLPVRAVADSELLLPRPDPDWPGLGAAIACVGREEAQVLLVVGEQGHPLLAFANRGLGRVAAFAADLQGPGSDGFRSEQGFPARLSQWVQALRRPLPAGAPEDLLEPGAVLSPPRPTPADAAALAAATGSPLEPLDGWQVPPPRAELVRTGMAAAWALPAALALLLLALGEWLFGRLRPHG